MSTISRIVIYLVVLGLGAILGILAFMAHAFFGGWLTNAGYAPNACEGGCSNANFLLVIASPFVTAITASAGMFLNRRGLAIIALVIGLVGYAITTQVANYPLQYMLVLVAFASLAYLVGDRAKPLIHA